ncbi:formin-E-like [Pistacia vera]|uniref:formin-E-like n=1 Tax=Pistacia vera TaxID=55513 RepID=UPI0012636315|nr:formin-E-like [Pistacia vera]
MGGMVVGGGGGGGDFGVSGGKEERGYGYGCGCGREREAAEEKKGEKKKKTKIGRCRNPKPLLKKSTTPFADLNNRLPPPPPPPPITKFSSSKVESCLLKEVRSRLASQEQSFVKENLTRQEAETKAKNMEEEICRLQKTLEERNGQLEASASNTEKCDRKAGGNLKEKL